MQNWLWNCIHYHINFIAYICNFSDRKDDNEYSKLCRKLLINHSIKIKSIHQALSIIPSSPMPAFFYLIFMPHFLWPTLKACEGL